MLFENKRSRLQRKLKNNNEQTKTVRALIYNAFEKTESRFFSQLGIFLCELSDIVFEAKVPFVNKRRLKCQEMFVLKCR